MSEMSRPTKRRSRCGAFTLIELLVVIAIIAILAAILFPVFARARENARRASCQSNLKQVGLGIMQYLQDYDEFMPWGETWVTSADESLCTNQTYCASGYKTDTYATFIQPYVKSTQIFVCPSGPQGSNNYWSSNSATASCGWPVSDSRLGWAYAYNGNVLQEPLYDTLDVVGSADCRWTGARPMSQFMCKSSKITRSSEIVMLTDRQQWDREFLDSPNRGGWWNGQVCDDPNGTYASQVCGSPGGYGTNPHFRHLDTANFLFVDGHVKAFNRGQYALQRDNLSGRTCAGCLGL